MSVPVLYFDKRSPPVRSVLLLVEALAIPVTYHLVDLFKVEHLKEDFLKVNPLHTVPCLQHNDLLLTDSHAILVYLCDVYGKGTALEIDGVVNRAKILNKLMFNGTVLFEREKIIMRKIFLTGKKDIDPKEMAAVKEAVQYLDKVLATTSFVAGDYLTIADFSIVASFSTISLVLDFPQEEFPNVAKWFAKMQELPYYQKANQEGLDALKDVMKEICAGEVTVKSRTQATN
ncbi:glutathione S-transferase E14-like isoform X2 [Culicoides brevitarsis]|uniref:glutathione S-transferase E14-like isoform X2 n=1 Tax=Culicoides brevitarsis TaxID=469753 RepID=UPI00307BB445